MANTYVDYTASAAQTDFAFSFDYLEDEHVTVEIDGVATTAFTIVTTPSTKVVLDSGATAGQIVRVRRKSQPDTNLVDFVNGSVLTESELDRAYLHNRYLAEEISELNDQSLQVEAGGTQWDAKSLRIKNVDTPTDGTDATNKTYVDTNDALKVAKAGDSMTGELAMGGNKVTGLGTPTDTTDASTKNYVDSKVNQVSSGASSPPTKWVFTGVAGANTTYSVTGAEVNGDTAYDVSIDGAVKEPTTDYTVDPDAEILTIVPTLSGGEDIVVIERGFGVAVTGIIGSSQIQDGAVTAVKLQGGAVTAAKLDTNAVTAAKIQNGAVTASKLDTNAVTNSKIQADAVDGSKIADDSIDSEHYVDGSIDTAHIANNQITAAKITTTDPVFNVQSTGEVGIGLSNPEEFHADARQLVVRSAADDAGITVFSGTATGKGNIFFADGVGSGTQDSVGGITYDHAQEYLILRAGGNDNVYIEGNGNVGIGTDDPNTKLEVKQGTAVNTLTEALRIIGGNYSIDNNAESFKFFHQTTNTNTNRGIAFKSIDGSLQIQTIVTSSDLAQANNICIQPEGGNVGIGTDDPTAPLEVSSTTGGVILPRLTDTEMNAVSNPTNGEIIYNTTRNQFWGYANGIWQNL